MQDEQVSLEMHRTRDHFLFSCTKAGRCKPQHASIPRWHFWMVLDTERNSAYEKAIHRAIEALHLSGIWSVNVLDIGSGSGLLSLIAAR